MLTHARFAERAMRNATLLLAFTACTTSHGVENLGSFTSGKADVQAIKVPLHLAAGESLSLTLDADGPFEIVASYDQMDDIGLSATDHAAISVQITGREPTLLVPGAAGPKASYDLTVDNPSQDVITGTLEIRDPLPTTVKVTGTAIQAQAGTPLAGVTLSAYRSSDDSLLATTTSDAAGMYSLTITTTGQGLDGYVKASNTGYVDTYFYPAGPLVADLAMADVNMLDTAMYGLLRSIVGGSGGKGLIALEVRDASETPVAGVTVSSTPASGGYRYSDASGLPLGTAGTIADGRAFMFDVPAGDVSIAATKTGATFKSHILKARADQFTTTIVTE
jgi:hypothetical protein